MADAHGGRTELLDDTARLVDRTTHISSFRDLNHVHLDERARVDVHDRAIDFGGDSEVTARVRQVRQDDLGAVERQACAGGVGAEFGLRHVRRQADRGDGFDELAGFHGVAIGATDIQDGDASKGGVGVEGDLARAERAGGGTTADGQLCAASATTRINPDVAEGVGTDIVRAAEDNSGRATAAADDEAVGAVGGAQGAIEARRSAISRDLGVAIEGNRARDDGIGVQAEGPDTTLTRRGVVGEVQAESWGATDGL